MTGIAPRTYVGEDERRDLLADATGPFRIPEDDWPDATEHRISIVDIWLGTVA
jgi:hypothetical protein